MLKNIPIENILFLDIETVPQEESWENLSEKDRYLWDKKRPHKKKRKFLLKHFILKETELWQNLEKLFVSPSEWSIERKP